MTNDEAYDVIYGIASGEIRDVEAISRTIQAASA